MKQVITSLLTLLMADQPKTIAVIGNAGNLLDKPEGSKIDAYDIVIRLNSFVIDPKFYNYTGKKTDIWCNAMHHKVPYRDNVDTMNIVCPLPLNVSQYLQRYGATNRQMLDMYKQRTLFIPELYFTELLQHLINPSTGIAMLYWLKKENLKFDIFGFSFFDNSCKHHYHDDRAECGHNGLKEKTFYEKYIL
jgi:hypothetical protein